MIRTSQAGISGLSVPIGGGVSSQTRLSVAMLELPRNGARPVQRA